MSARAQGGWLLRLPLILTLWAISSLSMLLPAAVALIMDDEAQARVFFYSALLGMIFATIVALAIANRPARFGAAGQLISLMATFLLLPVYLALPVSDSLTTTTYLNAYLDMVSALTTTGLNLFKDPSRLSDALHLWRAMVGWMGGLLMWVAASAILAPMSLGGFEVTARGAPGTEVQAGGPGQARAIDVQMRLWSVTLTLTPIYATLTGVMWILLMIAGDTTLVALCHAMSVMATSGISPVNGIENSVSGLTGEAILFLFMFFALSRLTFSKDTVSHGYGRLDKDPEFRIALLIVIGVPILLFLRHWISIYDVETASGFEVAGRAFWGAMFTVMSHLTTTGFVSSEWETAQMWSGLGTTGLILLGLALIGGGVATTAGGVKLLRVYALYLNGLREMERLVHPSSVSGAGMTSRRIQRDGAFIAWVFFMLFGLSLALITVVLAAFEVSFEQALVLAVASLSTTGPLVDTALDEPIRVLELGTGPKLIICVAMVLGRLETLAIVALLTPNLWRT
ncbi:MAG: potassium transporter TrkG [Pseudomonadota bacterium]